MRKWSDVMWCDLDRDLDIVEKEQQQQQQKQPMEQQPLEEFKNEFMLEEDEAVEEEDIDDTDGSLDSDAMMMMDENLNSTLGSEFLSLFAWKRVVIWYGFVHIWRTM